jgi:hypothetical protein
MTERQRNINKFKTVVKRQSFLQSVLLYRKLTKAKHAEYKRLEKQDENYIIS